MWPTPGTPRVFIFFGMAEAPVGMRNDAHTLGGSQQSDPPCTDTHTHLGPPHLGLPDWKGSVAVATGHKRGSVVTVITLLLCCLLRNSLMWMVGLCVSALLYFLHRLGSAGCKAYEDEYTHLYWKYAGENLSEQIRLLYLRYSSTNHKSCCSASHPIRDRAGENTVGLCRCFIGNSS